MSNTNNDCLAAELAAAKAEIQELRTFKEEVLELQALNDKLADILTRTANAIRGEPEPLMSHSWADLPERAAKLRLSAERWNAVIGCARIRALGSAGLVRDDPNGYAHR